MVLKTGRKMEEFNKTMFMKFWNVTDRKKITISEKQKVGDLHKWGVINKSAEKSPTLKGLIQDREVYERKKLPDGRNYTFTFEKIMEELEFTYTKADVALNENSRRCDPIAKCVVIKTETTPLWTFNGAGKTKVEAIEAASRKGVCFLISVSSDNVVF